MYSVGNTICTSLIAYSWNVFFIMEHSRLVNFCSSYLRCLVGNNQTTIMRCWDQYSFSKIDVNQLPSINSSEID